MRPLPKSAIFLVFFHACTATPSVDDGRPRLPSEPTACVAAQPWRRDGDGDGLGDDSTASWSCDAPPGWVAAGGDCDDGDAAIGGPTPWHVDEDGDGYGAIEAVDACERPAHAVADASDCDDAHAAAHPGGVERCADGLDGDCDGSAAPCRYDGEVSLGRALRFAGHAEYGEGGRPVVGAGDIHGDGFDDVLVGAGFAPGAAEEAGEVYLLTGGLTASAPLSDAATAIFAGDSINGHLGVHARVGDTDGDGRAEMLLFETGGSPRCVLVAAPPAVERLPFSELTGPTVPALPMITGLGDLDQDGYDDLIGADTDDWTGGYASGAAFVFTGPIAGELTRDDATYTFYGTEGMTVHTTAEAGDLDGDGRPDVALGGPGASFGGLLAGAVYVVTEPVPGAQSLADADAILHGAEREEQAGSELDGAGDVDGDGYGDLLVGSLNSRSEDGTYVQDDAVTLVLGPPSGEASLAEVGLRFRCEDDYRDCASAKVAGLGDLDRDGYDDFAVGSALGLDPNGNVTGATWLFYGPVLAGGELDDLADAKLYADSHEFAGSALDAAGDVDGDGSPDLVIGAYLYSQDVMLQGAAYVVLGGAL